MNKKLFGSLSAVLLTATFSGCSIESTDSENIRTAGIWAGMKVDARLDGTSRVVVELNSGGSSGTNLELSAGDRLEVTAGGVTKIMQKDTDLFDIDYEATMDVNASNVEFVISFIRENDTDAPNSLVSLPEIFVISSPISAQDYFETDALQILWTPGSSGEIAELMYTITCGLSTGGNTSVTNVQETADDGEYTVALQNQQIFQTDGITRPQTCNMDISIDRIRAGSLDSNFGEGGFIRAKQTRTVNDVNINIQ